MSARIACRIEAVGDSTPSLRELPGRLTEAITEEHDRVGEIGLLAEQLAVVSATSLFGICARLPTGDALRRSRAAWVDLVVRGLESGANPAESEMSC